MSANRQGRSLLLMEIGVFTLASWAAFRLSERRARDRGMIDAITES